MRNIVSDRMKQLPMTAYAVAKVTGVKPQTMSNFLRGGAMRSDKLERVFAVLGLEVRLDAQSEIFSLVRALQPIGEELEVRGLKKFDDTWNPDAHIKLTLRVRECRMIQELLKKHEVPAERETR